MHGVALSPKSGIANSSLHICMAQIDCVYGDIRAFHHHPLGQSYMARIINHIILVLFWTNLLALN